MTLSLPAQADPRDNKRYYFGATIFRKVLLALARLLFGTVMKLEVRGLENFPPEGPVVVAANHVTNFDVFPMQFSLPRPIFFMGKSELFRFFLMDAALRQLGAFPVNRGEKDQWAIAHAARVLRYGQTLGMFPEGTRSRGRGLRVAKTGAARLAIEANCPLVPMAIIGTDRFFRRFPLRARVTVTLLPALIPAHGETPLALTDRLMFALAAALPEKMRGVYAERPRGFGS